MRHVRRRLLFLPLAALALTGLTGCATDLKPTANTPGRTQRPTGFYASSHGATRPNQKDHNRALDEWLRGKKHAHAPGPHPGDVSEAQLGSAVVDEDLPRTAVTPHAVGQRYHVLKRGETLYSVARSEGVTAAELQRLNGFVNPSTLPVGTKVLLPGRKKKWVAEKAPVAIADSAPPGYAGPNELSARGTFHTVKDRENLGVISQQYGVAPEDIRKWNPREVSRGLKDGMTLYIPAPAERSREFASAPPQRHVQPPAKPMVTFRAGSAPTTRSGNAPTTFQWPVRGPVISGFGARRGRIHTGVDIQAAEGTPVHAALPGKLIFSGVMRGYGNVIILDHQNGYFSVYAHNNRNLLVREDAGRRTVQAGEVIALVGQTGNATRPHLHFEIRQFNNALDPLPLLPRQQPIPMANGGPVRRGLAGRG
jgi:murein DD-endopeptidase MepM/ murein hydrolase activator NlpD